MNWRFWKSGSSSTPTAVKLRSDRPLQYCLSLLSGQTDEVDARVQAEAWNQLEEQMASVPAGTIVSTSPGGDPEQVRVEPLHIDRLAVSNGDFLQFVQAGGYEQLDLWPEEVWANVVQFTDQTGFSGPRFWKDGKPLKKTDTHPVVGICWYEANAFAKWTGKRLPRGAEWERAASWATTADGMGIPSRYPWGAVFDPQKANTWAGGEGGTVPVDRFTSGATPNGVYQLIGNAWEWVLDDFAAKQFEGHIVETVEPMAEVRGGAFDTYFDTQASCQFRTGHSRLVRAHNVGFRCVVSVADLLPPPSPSAFFAASQS